jgi:hypothetical protein
VALLEELRAWLQATRAKVSGKSPLASAIGYALGRWAQLTRYRDDGRLEIDDNAAERAIRAIALGRKNWLFAGSDEGGDRAAALYTLIETAELKAWTRKPGCATSLPGSPPTRPGASTSSCPGVGPTSTIRPPPPEPAPAVRSATERGHTHSMPPSSPLGGDQS